MSLLEKALKKIEESKQVQEEKIVPDRKEIKPENLKPPKPTKSPPKHKKLQEPTFFIDWDYLAHNSSFQRGFTEFIKYTFPQYKGIDHRASKKVMNQQLKEKTNEIDIAMNIVSKIDSELLRELRNNPLYKEQKLKHNK